MVASAPAKPRSAAPVLTAPVLAALALTLAAGCSSTEPVHGDQLPGPSQAVDDEDEAASAMGDAQQAADSMRTPGEDPSWERDAGVGEQVDAPSGEAVATEAEVAQRRRERRLELARARDEGEAAALARLEARLAATPPPEPLGPSEPVAVAWDVVDYALAGLLVAALAAVLTLLIALFLAWRRETRQPEFTPADRSMVLRGPAEVS